MPIDLALYQPDIPQNTGTLIRLCACMRVRLHIIHPTGFGFSEARLRRSGMDYIALADLMEHDDHQRFDEWRRAAGRRLVLLTTKAGKSAYKFTFTPQDILLLGRESAGVPQAVADSADARIRIPMHPDTRSLNVAVAGAMVLGEALRQTDALPGP